MPYLCPVVSSPSEITQVVPLTCQIRTVTTSPGFTTREVICVSGAGNSAGRQPADHKAGPAVAALLADLATHFRDTVPSSSAGEAVAHETIVDLRAPTPV